MLRKPEHDPERAVNLYIEAATERLRLFHSEVQRVQAQALNLQRKIEDANDFIRHYHERAKEALTAGDEAGARKQLEAERDEVNRQAKLREAWKEFSDAALQLEAQYEKLQERLEKAKAARIDILSRRQTAQSQSDAFAVLTDVNLYNPSVDFHQLEQEVMRAQARSEAEYEVFQPQKDELSLTIESLKREMEAGGGRTDSDSIAGDTRQ